MRAQAGADVEEYQLWASLALELLGKAALAAVHPALVADPQHWQSLFAACGRQVSADIKTVGANTLFPRLGHIEKAFDSRHQKFCEQMALRRNAELHSGESPFSGMLAEAWENEYWGAVVAILEMQGESLESWLGAEDSKAPAQVLLQAEEAMKRAVTNRIARSKEDFEGKYKSLKKRDAAVEATKDLQPSEVSSSFTSAYDEYERSECPACGSSGIVAGRLWSEDVAESQDDDPWSETVEAVYTAEEFVCPTCGLHLFGTKELDFAGLPDEFTTYSEREREFEPDYGND